MADRYGDFKFDKSFGFSGSASKPRAASKSSAKSAPKHPKRSMPPSRPVGNKSGTLKIPKEVAAAAIKKATQIGALAGAALERKKLQANGPQPIAQPPMAPPGQPMAGGPPPGAMPPGAPPMGGAPPPMGMRRGGKVR